MTLPSIYQALLRRLEATNWKVVAIAAGSLLAAAFMGQLAASGNLILAAASLGAMVVLGLMFAPALSVWVIIVLPLGLSGFIALGGLFASKATWLVSVLSLILLAPSLLNLFWSRRAPSYVWVGLVFIIYALAVSLISGIDARQLVGGFKRYFQGYGLLFALAILPFAASHISKWRMAFFVLACIQLPMCLFQLLVMVPLRGGFAKGENTDVVAGTFGGYLEGGSNNSDLVLFQLTALAFLVAFRRNGLVSLNKFWALALIFLLPLAMGETKIVVVLLPLCLACVYAEDLAKNPLKLIPWSIAAFGMAYGLATAYSEFYIGLPLPEVIEDTLRYNIEDVGYGLLVLNRWTSITFWLDNHGIGNLPTLLFGHGLSASYTTQFLADCGHISQRYPGFGLDLTGLSALLWDVGVVGLFLFSLILLLGIFKAFQLARNAKTAQTKSEAIGIRTGLIILFVYLPYNNTSVNLVTTELIAAALLGYLALIARQNENSSSIPDR
jgi:hypothetical protein